MNVQMLGALAILAQGFCARPLHEKFCFCLALRSVSPQVGSARLETAEAVSVLRSVAAPRLPQAPVHAGQPCLGTVLL